MGVGFISRCAVGLKWRKVKLAWEGLVSAVKWVWFSQLSNVFIHNNKMVRALRAVDNSISGAASNRVAEGI